MFRNGQWVIVKAPFYLFPEAMRGMNGGAIGIFVAAHEGDANKPPHDAYIQLVDAKGENLSVNVDGINSNVKISPFAWMVYPVTDRRDIPPERIKHLPESWQPQP